MEILFQWEQCSTNQRYAVAKYEPQRAHYLKMVLYQEPTVRWAPDLIRVVKSENSAWSTHDKRHE